MNKSSIISDASRSHAASKVALAVICLIASLIFLAGCSEKNEFIGNWKIIGAYGSYSGTQVDATWNASGTVKVTSNHISIDAKVDGEEFKEEGTFEAYTPQGRPGYIANSGALIAIGESNGKYIVSFMSGDLSDGALGFYLERS